MARTIWCEHAVVDDSVHHGVTLTIEGGTFTGVAPHSAPGGGVEQRRGLTLPGLANAHSHAFHRALRHRTHGDGGTFWSWREQMYAAAQRLDPDTYFALARATFAEMMCAGFTSVGEFHYLHHQPDGRPYADANAMSNAVLAAANDAGLRITLLDVIYLHGGLGPDGHQPLAAGQRRFSDGSVERWRGRAEALRLWPTQRLGAAVHSVRAVDPAAIAQVAEWADHHQAVLHAHVSEQPAENDACRSVLGATPAEVLDRCGALGERFTAVHATHLTDADIALLAGHGASVCLCPTTEADLADGIGPAAALHQAGVALCLGTDSQASIDPFEEARRAELDQRLRSGYRGTLEVTALAAMIGPNGHASLGWNDAGRLAPGYRADLVTVSLDGPRLAGHGRDHLLAAAMFAAAAGDVSEVTIDGRDVVRAGRHLAIDVASELDTSIRQIMGR